MAVVEAHAGHVFSACFQMLSRVSEVDSMVRVLHLVTVMLEALGPKAQPHFAAITAALPQVSIMRQHKVMLNFTYVFAPSVFDLLADSAASVDCDAGSIRT